MTLRKIVERAYLLCLLQQFLDVTVVCGLQAMMPHARTCSLTNPPKLSVKASLENRYLTVSVIHAYVFKIQVTVTSHFSLTLLID